MKEMEVILRAISGEIKWIQAADILEVSPRTIRRKHQEYLEHGIDGLFDRRRGSPSLRKAPYEVVEQVLKLHRDSYKGYNVQHFHEHGIDKVDEANRYIEDVFIPDMNHRFSVEPANRQSAFFSTEGLDIDRIFSIRYENRSVAADNTVRANSLVFQIEESLYRSSFAKCRVDVFEHLDGGYSIVWKGRTIGQYDRKAKALGGAAPKPPKFSALETREEKKRRKSMASASSPVNRKRSGRSSPDPYPPAIY